MANGIAPTLRAPSEFRRNASDRDIHRLAGLKRRMEAAGSFWLYADYFRLAAEPRRNAGDQSTTANGNEYRIELRRLVLPLASDAPLPGDRFNLHRRHECQPRLS